ncbi:MAG: DUF4097 family beta strand repeat-containing protein [Nocardioides sp.]|nr:DUF4097 family beta strand repeat-containing protein [Nocardioides sp.]
MRDHPTEQHFPGSAPRPLTIEIGSGSVTVTLHDDAPGVSVQLRGAGAPDMTIEERDGAVEILQQRNRVGFLGGSRSVDVRVDAPAGCDLWVRTGSAGTTVSGDAGDIHVATGSGTLRVAQVSGAFRAKSGSGTVRATRVAGDTEVTTGSGDVELGSTHGPVRVKTGSGDLSVGTAHDTVAYSTASGDLLLDTIDGGAVHAKAASGAVRVGVAAGTPVWTDITTVSGTVHNDLESLGAPVEGQSHVEVRARTVSGSVHLHHVRNSS